MVQTGDSVTWTQTFDNWNVGTGKTLTPAGVVTDGNSGNNYSYTYTPVTTGVITQKSITVTPDSGQTKVYNKAGADPTLTYSAVPPALESGDSLTGTLARAVGTNVGSYAINLGTLANSNYNISLAVTPVNFSITARPLTVTAATDTKE